MYIVHFIFYIQGTCVRIHYLSGHIRINNLSDPATTIDFVQKINVKKIKNISKSLGFIDLFIFNKFWSDSEIV